MRKYEERCSNDESDSFSFNQNQFESIKDFTYVESTGKDLIADDYFSIENINLYQELQFFRLENDKGRLIPILHQQTLNLPNLKEFCLCESYVPENNSLKNIYM